MLQLTPHFKLEDFRCKDGTAYPAEWVESILIPLCLDLEVIREESDGPLYPLCGYRTKEYNIKIYQQMGKEPTKDSEHCKGTAIDLCSRVVTPFRLRTIIIRLIAEKKIRDGGVGIYNWGVHYDHGKAGRRWDERTIK